MTEELEVLKTVTERLNQSNIPYMVSGSIVSSYYSVPRMTRDIDIVIELKQPDVKKFVELFSNDFYVDSSMVTSEVLRGGMFNIIQNQYMVKIDFIIKKSSDYQQAAFLRSKQVLVEQSPMWFIAAEDRIISKLLWAKDSHSEMQMRDVRNLIKTVGGLDLDYVNNWAQQLGLDDLLKEAKQ